MVQWRLMLCQVSLEASCCNAVIINKIMQKEVLILFCSCVFDELLWACNLTIEVSEPTI